MTCDTGRRVCEPGSACGSVRLQATPLPSNLLVVLDRSCSMQQSGPTLQGKSKWEHAAGALSDLVANDPNRIRFGLELFPDVMGEACTMESGIDIPVSDTASSSIRSVLTKARDRNDPLSPHQGPCVTNIDTAMATAKSEPAFSKPGANYVLLLTDGMPSRCAHGSTAAAASATETHISELRMRGVGTFVVGFGSGTNPTHLDAFANAGGHTNPKGPYKYYQADDPAALAAALSGIAAQARSCSVQLASAPEDWTKVYVFGDGARMERDTTHASGWDLDSATNRITLYGAQCDAYRGGSLEDVHVVFGCPQDVPK